MSTYKRKSLISLIELAKADDEKALAELVKRYQHYVYEVFFALSPQGDLFDLTQEAMVKMAKSIKNLKNPEKFNAWLNQIVHNLFYDSLRKKRRVKEISIESPIHASDDEIFKCFIDERKTPDENFLSCELKEKINSAIQELPPLFRTIILLREIDGLSYEEISNLTNLNIGTVKSRIARARLKLQKELDGYLK